MTKPTLLQNLLLFSAFGALCLAPVPTFAQRGGGGHVGGGGGFHGASAPSGGGAFRGGMAAAPRIQPPASQGGGFQGGQSRGGAALYRPVAPVTGMRGVGGYRPATGYRPPPAEPNIGRPDGLWHSFANTAGAGVVTLGGAGSAGMRGNGFVGSGGIGGQANSFVNSAPANRMGAGSAARSFTGQGSEVFETTQNLPSVASRSRMLANAKAAPGGGLALGGSRGTSIDVRGVGPTLSAARLGGGLLHANVPTRSTSASLVASGRLAAVGGAFGAHQNFAIGLRGGGVRSGFGLQGHGFGRGFGRGRFGGFGFRRPWFGLGFFGPPAYIYPLGLNTCIWGPNWNGVGFGYDPFGYGYTPCYGPVGVGPNSPSYYNPSPDAGTYVYGNDPYDDSIDEELPPDTDTAPNVYLNAPTDDGSSTGGIDSGTTLESGAIRENVQVYLKSGAMFNVILYWVSGNRLHYVTDDGTAITMNLDQIDVDRTISENAKNGKFFRLPEQPE